MPARLRPTAPIAADAMLVGDPGRALMLAQELLQEPKMSNHARGLWGYTGLTAAGTAADRCRRPGWAGPAPRVVLADLAELGVRRAVRVGTCTGLDPALAGGQLVTIDEAHAWGGPAVPARRSLPEPGPDGGAAARARRSEARAGDGRQPRHPARRRSAGAGRGRPTSPTCRRRRCSPRRRARSGDRGGADRHRDDRGRAARRRGGRGGGQSGREPPPQPYSNPQVEG